MLAEQPHHDGSDRYTQRTTSGDMPIARVWVRVPAASAASRVRVRAVPDAEPLLVDAAIDTERTVSDDIVWWVADLPLHNPVTNYRFLLEGATIGYGWLNGSGIHRHDVPDAHDFRISTYPEPPTWLDQTVGYQVFLDRFASSGEHGPTPEWAIRATWDTPVAQDSPTSTHQLYGGDLSGVEKHLDHLERLGIDLIYLTPFFPAESAHRYDATTFDHVDPLLGGDTALASLVAAAHERGIRVIGDITLNHTGEQHSWFRAAQLDLASPEGSFYMFGESADDYVAWHDVPTLPKLDHRSTELAGRLYSGDRSTIARFLDVPFGLDGWRVDCANTTGRHGDVDRNRDVATAARRTIDRRGAVDGRARWLVAEHCYDAGNDLDGDGWHGSMAYQWFTRPIWSWLRGERPFTLMSQIELPSLGGDQVVQSMRELGANVTWAARLASMTMLDSHDSARFRTAVGGNRMRHIVGLAALLSMPGVPTIFAGSEVGVVGDSMDTCRVPFPWDESQWDRDLFDATTQLIRIRHDEPALQRGALRWIDASSDAITFVRELAERTVLVDLRRAPGERRSIPMGFLTDRPIRHVDTRFDSRASDTDRADTDCAGIASTDRIDFAESAGVSIIALVTG